MTLKDKGVDPNSVLIPREMSERKKLYATKKLHLPTLSPEESMALRRFETLPINSIGDTPVQEEEDEDEEETPSKKKKKGLAAREHAPDPSRKHYAGACPRCGGRGASGKVTVTGENYRHLYMEQQKQKLEAVEEVKKSASVNMQDAQRKAAEKEKELQQIARAHDLQDQLVYWKQQAGQGQYDSGTINGMISQLETELGTIPAGYWK